MDSGIVRAEFSKFSRLRNILPSLDGVTDSSMPLLGATETKVLRSAACAPSYVAN